jgi:hyperosmotically inducible protein
LPASLVRQHGTAHAIRAPRNRLEFLRWRETARPMSTSSGLGVPAVSGRSMTMHKQKGLLALGAIAVAAAGCNQRHEVIGADSADIKLAQAVADGGAASTDGRTKDLLRDAAPDLKEAPRDAGDTTANKVADAVISSSVNAELAKDPRLSFTQIDVDTQGGHVALHGTAPDESSRARATQLTSEVKGVVSVNNQLSVQANR